MERHFSQQRRLRGRRTESRTAPGSRGTAHPGRRGRHGRAFSLIELLVAMAVITLMLLMLAEMTGSVADTWAQGESRVEAFQSARASLELITREMTPAVVDTHMQFAILPAEELEPAGAFNLVAGSQAALWMAPLGEQGDLRCVGYYLYRDDVNKFYRLKRILIRSEYEEDADPRSKYFPDMLEYGDAAGVQRVSAVNAGWFTSNWDRTAFNEEDPNNKAAVVSTVADGVVALWIQPIDMLGNPIPWLSVRDGGAKNHPQSDLIYNSAAYMYFASPYPFDDTSSTAFMKGSDLALKANRVPAAVDITVVTLDNRTLVRNPTVPLQENKMFETDKPGAPKGALDLVKSVRAYNEALVKNGIKNARTFSTRVKLLNGS